ncbi:Signal transduction histidine kinase [Eubacterium ruminantium]|nr:Signal transduction histidine kinase [Eubacterium ruminantium]
MSKKVFDRFNKNIGVGRVKESRFPFYLFWIILVTLLVTAGVNVAIILLMQNTKVPAIIQTHLLVFYWLFVAIALTVYVRYAIKKNYDEPLQEISDVTKEVAKGNFDIRIEPIHTEEKNIDYLDVMISDLNKMIEELGSIETLKQDFISNISHELKTPMAVIKNYAEMMQSPGADDEQLREYAGVIKEAAVRMTELISNILRLNRFEHQKIVPNFTEVDISRNLCDSILQFESSWDRKNIDLDVDVEDKAIIRSDGASLTLVWNNLISNAIKFSPEGGRITISQSSDKNSVTVSVRDNGCGMSEETVRHIFDKFYQGDTSHATEGNGLGLALVKRILVLVGGTIEVKSKEYSGSEFIVTLPK